MRDLIERLRAATGPDRELDALIYGFLHGLTPQGTLCMPSSFQYRHPTLMHPAGPASLYVPEDRVAEFTDSIDAALTLLPEPAYWRLGNDGEGSDPSDFKAEVMSGADMRLAIEVHEHPALALCIAALMAREAAHA